MEKRSEIYLSTLRSYIKALGGHLEITAVFDDERVPVAVGAGKRRSVAAYREPGAHAGDSAL